MNSVTTRLSAMVFVVASTFTSLPVAAETQVYAVLLNSLVNPFWRSVELGIKNATAKQNIQYYLQSIESDNDTSQQLALCNSMLDRQPSAILAAAVNATNLLPCVEKAQQLNIPFIDLNGIIESESGISFSINSTRVESGAQGAKFIAQHLGPDASGSVLVMEAFSYHEADQIIIDSFTETLYEVAPKLRIVGFLAAAHSRYQAANVTTYMLTRYDDLSAIFTVSDIMALGASDAAYNDGRREEMTIVGIQGTKEALDAIERGQIDASVARYPYSLGRQAVEAASALVNGQQLADSVLNVSTTLINKATIDYSKSSSPLE